MYFCYHYQNNFISNGRLFNTMWSIHNHVRLNFQKFYFDSINWIKRLSQVFGIQVPEFLFESSKDSDIKQALFNCSSGVLFMSKQIKTSGIKNQGNYVRRTLIWLKCQVWKSMVHRYVDVFSVAVCVELWCWVMGFKKHLLMK